MNYDLEFSGVPGNVNAKLIYGGKVVSETTDLSDGNAARKWATKAAKQHKTETAKTVHREEVSIVGSSTFSV